MCTIFTTGMDVADPRVHMLRAAQRGHNWVSEGLSTNPEELCTGCNGGYQVIDLLVQAGVQRLILLGYDGKPGANGKMHWFGDHPATTPHSTADVWVKKFRTMVEPLKKLGVQVLNANPDSAIDAFPKVKLESILLDS